MTRWSARFPAQSDVGAELLRRYTEPHRVYHGVEHLRYVCDRLDWLAGTERVDDSVELAAWFHDAVYEIGRADNEERSAQLARVRLFDDGLDTAEVARLVLLTADHQPEQDDLPGSLLCAADLAILAAEQPVYDRYARQVRAEFAELDADVFDAGRSEVLRRLLAHPRLFMHPRARTWEARARDNLRRELSALAARFEHG
jgi:predicted metal-dependent HD superfamily phosphohydrolase